MNAAKLSNDARPAVLVVEDELHVCELVADMLGHFEVSCAGTDTEALDRLRAGSDYDCLVVDVNLGRGLTGYDVARFARRLAPGLPVLFISGEASRRSFEVHGVQGARFLAKPFSAEDLCAQVDALVGAEGGETEE